MSQIAKKSTGGSSGVAGGSGGGGRKRPNCVGGPGRCDCPDCREKKAASIAELSLRRARTTGEIAHGEVNYIMKNKKNPAGKFISKNPSVHLQSAYRRHLGMMPEIHPLLHPDPPSRGISQVRVTGPSPLNSRWIISQGTPEGSWKEILDLDEWNIGYINRLYRECQERAILADLMDSFCRDRHRLADVLDILGNVCLFRRMVPTRSNPRELMTSRQLDAAYHMEHPEPMEENMTLGLEHVTNRNINLGLPLPADNPEPDEDIKFDDKVGNRPE